MSGAVRALRGATTVEVDDVELMVERVGELVRTLLDRNDVVDDDLVSAIFTSTPDLTSIYAATAARRAGGIADDVPLIGAVEAAVDGGLERCVRVMIHVMSDRGRSDVEHVYLHGATVLRPDLSGR